MLCKFVPSPVRSHSRARVGPARKLPLLPECGLAELPASPGRELAFSFNSLSPFLSAAAESVSVQDLQGIPVSLWPKCKTENKDKHKKTWISAPCGPRVAGGDVWPFLPRLNASGVAILLPHKARHGLTVVGQNPERPAWV